jgi:hypothetical protein
MAAVSQRNERVPSLNAPQYGAFDQPTYHIDLSPFLHVLCAGPANISLTVKGSDPEHHVLDNWFVSGSLQIFLARTEQWTTGKMVEYSVEPFAETTISTEASDDKEAARAYVTARRHVHIESRLTIDGRETSAIFNQAHLFKNLQHYLQGGTYEVRRCAYPISTHLRCSRSIKQAPAPPGPTLASSMKPSFPSPFDATTRTASGPTKHRSSTASSDVCS